MPKLSNEEKQRQEARALEILKEEPTLSDRSVYKKLAAENPGKPVMSHMKVGKVRKASGIPYPERTAAATTARRKAKPPGPLMGDADVNGLLIRYMNAKNLHALFVTSEGDEWEIERVMEVRTKQRFPKEEESNG